MKEYPIPETISDEIFNLPCVNSISKSDKSFIYVCMAYTMEDNKFQYAKPGDTLVQLDNGKWRIMKKGEQQ